MAKPNIISLPVAVRVYPTQPASKEPRARRERTWRLPDAMLVFDTETRTDATQRFIFGSWRYFIHGKCMEEGLIYAEDLPDAEQRILEAYAATHSANVSEGGNPKLRLMSRKDFANLLFRYAYRDRCLVVGFNLPFDISRIARDFTSARGRFSGGFSIGLWSYVDKSGRERPHPFRPRIGIKLIDNKRALKGFTARNEPDAIDLIPDGSPTGEPEAGYKFRGHFLDLRTVAFALTDVGYSLESACEAFGVEHGKQHVAQHGVVTDAYIDYNRRDVLATSELAFKLLAEYDKHPILLQVTRAYSPASIGKAYLRAMGIKPILERQPDFPKEYLGYAESAFVGGRASAHIRKTPVPIVHTDFLSMYPTVNSLMGLWKFVAADKIKVIEHCQQEIESFLSGLSDVVLYGSETWKYLTAFVKVIPDGDILPTRAKYSAASNDWQVAVSHLYAANENVDGALWFSLPDVVASVILTGRVSKIVDAFRIEAHGVAPDLQPTKLLGAIAIDPREQDFFKVAIEERKRLASRTDLSPEEKKRLDKALKVLANAASYGIYAEMNRQESDEETEVTCYGLDSNSFKCRVAHPDAPGEYCFSPFASLITGAARLMLALLEHCVTELGGTYAMEDTDSMAIVATKAGGLVPCPGGPYRTRDGLEAVKALSRKQVEGISQRFAALNPYDRSAVPGSILKIEDDNFDPKTGKQRQLYCYAISAKRYVLFLKNGRGIPSLLRRGVTNKADHWSRHGLGHLLNPSVPESEDPEWIAQVWLDIVHRALGLPSHRVPFADKPAVGRTSISSPAVLRPLTEFNKGKAYADQIKPFNFLLTCHVQPIGHPIGTDPEHFHLIAPYESNPNKWLTCEWIDQYTGKRYRITTAGQHGTRNAARVKTYGDVLVEYEFHPEAKCADAEGNPSGKQTVGLLQRRHVRIERIVYIGKESNSLEEVESGLIHSAENVYTEYVDQRRDEWQTVIVPALQKIPLAVLEKTSGFSRRMLIDTRSGRRRPHRRNQKLLRRIAKQIAPF